MARTGIDEEALVAAARASKRAKAAADAPLELAPDLDGDARPSATPARIRPREPEPQLVVPAAQTVKPMIIALVAAVLTLLVLLFSLAALGLWLSPALFRIYSMTREGLDLLAQFEQLQGRLDAILAAAARLQQIVPDAVLVGGTAAAVHAGHRVSYHDDHVVEDPKSRFDSVLADLEDTGGWITARVQRPVQVLGSLDGVETGVRNLIRRRPLEVELLHTPHGPVRIPTLAEMARIKAWLVLRRNATRDYLDLVALSVRLGDRAAAVLVELECLGVVLDPPMGTLPAEAGSSVTITMTPRALGNLQR
jgi:hypothetical protein